jgi:glycosyltransferase involved in cell wall biosynthesis
LRALFLNQFFYPDSAATGQLLGDVVDGVEHAAVVCGPSQYAEAHVGRPPAVRIHRTKPLPFSRSAWLRPASYGSFLAAAAWLATRLPTPDVVVTLTTPPFLGLVGTLLRRRGARHFSWEMDLYPDTALQLGYVRNSGAARALSALARWYRLRADGIIVLGDDMKLRLINQGIPADKIHVCENWADGREIRPVPFPGGPLHIYYSGNLGLAHDTATLTAALLALGSSSPYRFTFAGGGAARAKLQQFIDRHHIPGVEFRPYSSRQELGAALGQGHVCLVTQKTETLGCLVPSKTYGILAAGRPLLYIGPSGSTVARIIHRYRCGWHIEPGDPGALVKLLELLNAHRDLVDEAGARARHAFELHYDRPHGVDRLRRVLGLEANADRTAPAAASATAQPPLHSPNDC